MNPQKLQDRIYDWFERRYPDAGEWTNPHFHCYRDAPIELRVVMMTNRVEADVGNGGLPQLLWNCFHHWRVVLAEAEAGYRLFGAEPAVTAIADFRRLFERFEPVCRRFVEASVQSQDLAGFGPWYEATGGGLQSELEAVVCEEGDRCRLEWLAREEGLLRRLMRG